MTLTLCETIFVLISLFGVCGITAFMVNILTRLDETIYHRDQQIVYLRSQLEYLKEQMSFKDEIISEYKNMQCNEIKLVMTCLLNKEETDL
jgi:hypothetical protein